MLNLVGNPRNNPQLSILNKKIESYNKIGLTDIVQRALVLEEIDVMANQLFCIYQDNREDAYQPLRSWVGIKNELAKMSPPIATGFLKEMKLIELAKAENSISDLRKSLKSFMNQSRNLEHCVNAVEIARQNVYETDDPLEKNEANLRLFYELKRLKKELISNISNEKNQKKIRALVSQINYELFTLKNIVPFLSDRYKKYKDYAASDLLNQLNTFDTSHSMNDEMKLINLFYSSEEMPSGSKAKEQVCLLVPDFNAFEITKIARGNNVIWLLENQEIGRRFVVSNSQGELNNEFLGQLLDTPVRKYFVDNFATIHQLGIDMPFNLVLSDYCEGGNLHTEKSSKPRQLPEVVTLVAAKRLGKMIQFCRDLLIEGGMHTDIKLSNFLIKAERRHVVSDPELLISDTKAIQRIPKDLINTNEISRTPSYEPPELKGRTVKIDAEAYMTYQLGLALYEYLILPDVTFNEKDNKIALDFKHPYFKSNEGEMMQIIIEAMTKEIPSERPKLAKMAGALEGIAHSITNAHPSVTIDYKIKMELLRFNEDLEALSTIDAITETITTFKESAPYQLALKNNKMDVLESVEQSCKKAMDRISKLDISNH